MRISFILFFSLFSFLTIYGQTWEQVISSPGYIYGEGWGNTVAEADRQALNDLISKISVQVEGQVTVAENEKLINGASEATTSFISVVKTYSQATLNNTEKVVLGNEPDAHVGRWIKRSDLNKIFESRKHKILDYVNSAVKAEQTGKIDVALKDLYWAFCLLKSLQDPNSLSYTTNEGDTVLLVNWIPHRMDDIFNRLKTHVLKKEEDNVEIYITYKDIPVNSIDYSYFDGRDWSNIYGAKDGVGVIELAPGYQPESCRIKFEYEYAGESHIDKEVEAVMNSLPSMYLSKAYQSFKPDAKPVFGLDADYSASFAQVPSPIYSKPTEIQSPGEFQSAIDKIIYSLETKQYGDVKDLFTPYGYDIYQRLLKYGKARLVGNQDIKFYKSNDHITARGARMAFSFPSNTRKTFVEDLVFSFNDKGLIDNISFGLGKTAEDDILGKGVWDENARFAIVDFLENYQTAYALKRLDYIETIFDDDAVIITGYVVHRQGKRVSGDVNGIQFGGDIIRYNRHTKDSYLRELKRSFAGKEYINLRFADNEVRKLGKGGEVYAIQISQEYYSSNYGDKGYLFLMVDINDPENPVIKVRTWQPEKDPEFGVYGPEDFM